MEESVSSPSPRKYECTYSGCSMSFSRPNRLEIHVRTHTGERPYVCDYGDCKKSYVRKMHLDRHVETSHTKKEGVEIYHCTEDGCSKDFATKCGLDKHVKSSHHVPEKYRCPEDGCNKAFHKKHQLRAHSFEHNGVLPFQCEVEGCNKQFKQSSHLIRHKKSHNSYDCDEKNCAEKFEKWSLLREHKAAKHGKKHTCDICQKSYPRPALLAKHIKLHDADTVDMFKCSYDGCSRIYSEVRNLNSHIRSYHENKKFKCDNCGQELVNKSKLSLHLKKCIEKNASETKKVTKQYPLKGHRRKPVPVKVVDHIMNIIAPTAMDSSDMDVTEDALDSSDHVSFNEESVEQAFKRAEMETVDRLNSGDADMSLSSQLRNDDELVGQSLAQSEPMSGVEEQVLDKMQCSSTKVSTSNCTGTQPELPGTENQGEVLLIDINDLHDVVSIVPKSTYPGDMEG